MDLSTLPHPSESTSEEYNARPKFANDDSKSNYPSYISEMTFGSMIEFLNMFPPSVDGKTNFSFLKR